MVGAFSCMDQTPMKKWIFYGSAAAGVVLIALVVIWKSDRYPILMVNGVSIPAREYYAQIQGFERYRRVARDPVDANLVKNAVLMSLIADVIVRAELERRGAVTKAEEEVQAAIADKQDELEKSVPELYGWDIEMFRRFMLDPQARQNVLAAELKNEGQEFSDWLRGALLAASVSVYGIPYEWSDGRLVDKK